MDKLWNTDLHIDGVSAGGGRVGGNRLVTVNVTGKFERGHVQLNLVTSLLLSSAPHPHLFNMSGRQQRVMVQPIVCLNLI
jgi:hypothetical protein